MVLMWHHPKYYKELERIRKQMEKDNKRASKQANKQESERASSDQASGERASKRSSVRGGLEQQALNVVPIIHCEGRCFAVIKQKTGDRATLVKFYKVKGRLLY